MKMYEDQDGYRYTLQELQREYVSDCQYASVFEEPMPKWERYLEGLKEIEVED